MSETTPHVSVIVVTHNSLPALTACLRSLRRAVAGMTFELLVVDNASADGGPASALEIFPGATLLRNERNLGFAEGCNRGAAAAIGEILVFLNPDVQLDEEAVERLARAAAEQEKAGLVSGRLRLPDGSFQATCRRFPTIGNMIFSRGSAPARLFGGETSSRYTLPDSDKTTRVPAVAATLAAIRRRTFNELGGFDRRFFMYMEDTDLSLRLDQSGRANLFLPSAGGIHRWGAGSDAGRVRRLWYHHRSVWQYFLKHFPNGFSVVILPLLLALNFILRLVIPGRGGEVGAR